VARPVRLCLRRDQRIRKRGEFQTFFERGRFVRGRLVHLWTLTEESSGRGPRLGLIVSRKTHRNAAARNLWKRRIREIFRKNQRNIKKETVVLIQSRRSGPAPDSGALEEEIKGLLKQNGVWE
jgi:ribonuclease P protein component